MSEDRENSSDLPPVPPAEPDAADCCGEGCIRCIYDVYEESLERYRARLAAWQARHPDADADVSGTPR